MTDLFYTYKEGRVDTDDRILDQVYGTAAHATAAASDGGSDIDAETTAEDLPEDIGIGWIRDNSDGDKWREPTASDESVLESLKEAARATHKQLLVWTALLIEEGVFHTAEDVNLGHNFLFQGHRGVYIIMHRTTYTSAEKIVFCQGMVKGSANVTTPKEFFDVAHELNSSQYPMGPVIWVEPDTGTRITFDKIEERSRGTGSNEFNLLETECPVTVDLAKASWIEDLT